MTEFLVFLGLCLAFSVAFWLFLRRPSREQRIKAQVQKELRELYARAAAAGPDQPAEPAPPRDYPSGPFGEDIVNPDSRTIPPAFHGAWDGDGRLPETIAADRMVFTVFGRGGVGTSEETVVAVRYVDGPNEIAIVTRTPGGKFGLCYRGVKDGRLWDLENPGCKLDRC